MRRSRTQWQKLFDEHQQSGLTQTAFCKTRGINVKYFSRRRVVLSQDIPTPFVKARMVSNNLTSTFKWFHFYPSYANPTRKIA